MGSIASGACGVLVIYKKTGYLTDFALSTATAVYSPGTKETICFERAQIGTGELLIGTERKRQPQSKKKLL